jgi:hypothetical protein
MKRTFIPILFVLLIILSGCKKKEDEITANAPPTIAFISDENGFQINDLIKGAVGQTMTFRADIADDVGIKSFQIYYPDWDLNNTVDLIAYYPNEVLNNYTIEYIFLIPEDAIQSINHEIKLNVTNRGNLTLNSGFTVTLDGDYEAPSITNLYPGNNATVPPEGLKLSFDVTDNLGLQYVVVEVPSHNLYDSITSFSDSKNFHYQKFISGVVAESYTYSIRVNDHFNNKVAEDAIFHIGTPVLPHIFLVDKATQEELDKGFIGTTIRMIPTETEFEHSIVYYCEEAGTELRFMDNPYSFISAFNIYGVDGTSLVENGMNSPLILSARGYYTITLNTDLLSFEISGPVAPDDLTDAREVPDEPWLYGRGVDENHGGWDTYSDYMAIDPDNKYLFHIDTPLGDAENDGYCEGCIGFELLGSTEWDDEYIYDDICWFGFQWHQDGIIDEIDENGGKPDGWAGLAGEMETWSDDEENYWNTWADMTANYKVSLDMYTRRIRIFRY